MRALLLTKYDRLGASTRYRILQYLPYLSANGWSFERQPLLSDGYLRQLYLRERRSAIEVCAAYARRLRYLWTAELERFDVVLMQYEALPYIPFWIERPMLAKARNIVLDYDDAVFVPYEGSRLLRHKVAQLMRAAREVIVGNESLRRYAARHSRRVSLIPTVVDLNRYQPRAGYECRHPGGVVIGWVGTPITARYLATLSGVFQRLAERHPILVRCVGTPADFRIPGVPVENLAWSEETEAGLIRSFDIGVMPLADERFAHGKCGLKLVQYMACAIPSVGARLGANNEIVQHGVDGMLAGGDQDYVEIIERLIGDRALRERIGRAGRRTVAERYSLQVRAPEFCRVLQRAARGRAFEAQAQRLPRASARTAS
jgi:glycosyltransferase involved in cell wall biosynthesis